MTKAAKLAQAATAAAEVRAHQTNPDVAALAIERVRTIVTALIWCGVITFLAFTAVNVQQFYAAGSHGHSPAWWVAWVVDPSIAMFLIAMLIAEQVLSRYQVESGGWVRGLKWGAFAATYAMNTWSAWASLDVSAIVKHSIPPLLVVLAAEAVTQARHGLSKAIQIAHDQARQRLGSRAGTVSGMASEGVSNTAADTVQNTTRPVSDTVSSPVSNTAENTPQNTAADTARPVSNTASDTEDIHDYIRRMAEQERTEKRTEEAKQRPRKPAKRGSKKPREVVAREIYDAYMAEHHEVISNAALREELRKAGHPTGNRTAADLLVEFKAHPLHIAS